ncbi:MAG: hypothetical protein AB1898_31770 [Acidobacteriota bacterium]
MSSFKDLSVEYDVGSLYEGGIKVFVESDDDLAILRDKWFFNQKDILSFESVADPGGGSGGCRKVVNQVMEFKRDGRPAFGIVDRDVLLQDEGYRDTLWWETDDDVFAAAHPYGESVHVLRRWELENYLLQPEAVRQWLKDKLCSPEEPNFGAAEMLRYEDDLITISCTSTLAVVKAKPAPNEQFGRDKSGKELRDTILSHLSSTAAEITTHYSKIQAFAEEQDHAETHWDRLSRMLDGKRVLHRLSESLNKYHPKKNLSLFGDRAIIAGYIANNGTIDAELIGTINNFVGKTASPVVH